MLHLKQWQIKTFPEDSAPTPGGGDYTNLLFRKMFTENCMEMGDIGARRGEGRTPSVPPPQTLDPPMLNPQNIHEDELILSHLPACVIIARSFEDKPLSPY